MSRAELLRPFADAPCPEKPWTPESIAVWGGKHPAGCACHGTGLDPRFESLRCYHKRVLSTIHGATCPDCLMETGHAQSMPLGLRTDVGSVLRAAAACDPRQVDEGLFEEILGAIRGWFLDFCPEPLDDAVATAFVAALPERAA